MESAWSDDESNADSDPWGNSPEQTRENINELSEAWSPVREGTGTFDITDITTSKSEKPEHLTSYAKKGLDRQQISFRLNNATSCSCRELCRNQVQYSDLVLACEAFWGMTDVERAVVLHGLRDKALGSHGSRVKRYMIGSVVVCFQMFCALLGTSTRTFCAMARGDHLDKRQWNKRKNDASLECDFFSKRCTTALQNRCQNQLLKILKR
jgi:hypothetical protein